MSLGFGEMAVATTIATAIGIIVSLSVAMRYFEERELALHEFMQDCYQLSQEEVKENLKEWKKEASLVFVALFAGLYLVVNVAALSVTFVLFEGGQQTATIAQAARSFGLESGKAYPLELGSRFAGSSGNASVGVGGRVRDIRLSPATGVSVSFTNEDDQSWILEIPTNGITFNVVDDEKESSFVVNLGDEYADGFRLNYPPCRLQIKMGWWLCVSTEKPTIIAKNDAAQRGLGFVIAQAFGSDRVKASAVITLTREQYDMLLNDS